MFDEQVKDLGKDYRCVAFDSRARTDRWKGPYSLDDMADDCLALMDELGIENHYVHTSQAQGNPQRQMLEFFLRKLGVRSQ